MAILAQIPGTVTITAPGATMIFADIELADPDWFYLTVTLTNRAEVARAQRHQRLGYRIDVDRGDGVMVTIPDDEIENALTIRESVDLQEDIATIKLRGDRYSPFAGGFLQTKRKVEIFQIIGAPGAEFTGKVFTGHPVAAPYNVNPPSSDVTLFDAGALHLEKRAPDWSLPANSGRYRDDITLELLGIGNIPHGDLDFGPNRGGRITKPYTLGDRQIVDFLREFLRVRGIEVGFIDGNFVAVRYDPTRPPVMELNASNLFPDVSLTAPDTLAPNIIGVVSTSETFDDASGETTVETSSETLELYAEQVAAYRRILGVDNPSGLTSEATVQKTAETIIRTTYRGSLDVRTERIDRSMYAALAASVDMMATNSADVIDETFTTRPHESIWQFILYLYPDGSVRTEERERLMATFKSVATKEVDDAGRVVRRQEKRYRFRNFRRRLFDVHESVGILYDHPSGMAAEWVPVMDDGEGSVYGREYIGGMDDIDDGWEYLGARKTTADAHWTPLPDEITTTLYDLTSDGTIIAETTTDEYYDVGPKVMRRDGVSGYGLDDRSYHQLQSDALVSRVVRKTYSVIDEDLYRVIEVTRSGSAAPKTVTSTNVGSPPKAEQIQPTTTVQEIRHEVRDETRIALAGEEIRPPGGPENNEHVQGPEDAAIYAQYLARHAGAKVLTGTQPIEVQLHKWGVVTVNLPGSSIHGERFEVRSVDRNGATFSQGIVAQNYPPELA